MSNRSSAYQSLGPLTVGNVVSAALRIYRDRFSVYYKLAFTAYLWLIVPIYGWAKFMAISGLLSRLAYREVMGQPETVRDARRHVNPRLWTFFFTAISVSLILFIPMLFYWVIFAIVFLRLTTFFSQYLFVILSISIFVFGYIWLYSRLSLSELSIAIEERGIGESINRSWRLTKGFIFRLQLIFFVAYLLTIPIFVITQIINYLTSFVLAHILTLLPLGFAIYLLIYILTNLLISLIISFAVGALLIPFWQSIKSVIYYDLRTRKEGIDLQLRDPR